MEVKINTKRGVIVGDLNIGSIEESSILIICHGFRGTMDERQNKELAEYLHKTGLSTFRFDFGNSVGRSYGDIKYITVTNQIEDLSDVIKFIKNHLQLNSYKISVSGHSLGGLIAAHYASENELQSLILISAVYDFENRIKQFFGEENLSKWREGKISELYPLIKKNSAFDVGEQFFSDISKYYPQKYSNISCSTLIVEAENDTSVRSDQADNYDKILKSEHKKIKIEGADHIYSSKLSRSVLNKTILSFLDVYSN